MMQECSTSKSVASRSCDELLLVLALRAQGAPLTSSLLSTASFSLGVEIDQTRILKWRKTLQVYLKHLGCRCFLQTSSKHQYSENLSSTPSLFLFLNLCWVPAGDLCMQFGNKLKAAMHLSTEEVPYTCLK